MVFSDRTIDLLPAEKLLRELLLECSQSFPGLELWVAGGWVRDRLLSLPSSDLDIALSNTTGREFGAVLATYSARSDVAARYRQKAKELGVPGSLFSSFHIVKRNVAAAKTLETAGGRLFGLDVDLVNLRKETYDGLSRNPETQFGTPEEDAFRRDATVNALFFHLGREEVVDMTGMGLSDLEAKVMRTPLDPKQTFMDDPLRVLRLIRIGSRLDFAINEETLAAMRDQAVHHALDSIVKRERIGAELSKIFDSQDPRIALQYILEADLYTPVFIRPGTSTYNACGSLAEAEGVCNKAPLATWQVACNIASHIITANTTLGRIIRAGAPTGRLWAMVAYLPIAPLRHATVNDAVRDAAAALKMTTEVSNLLETSLKNFDDIHEVVRGHPPHWRMATSRSIVGMKIRSWGSSWAAQLLYVMLAEAMNFTRSVTGANSPGTTSSSRTWNTSCMSRAVVHRFAQFCDFVVAQDLQFSYDLRPILNGFDILRLYRRESGGIFLKNAMEKLLEWQLENPGCGREEAETWLVSKKHLLELPFTE